MNFPSLQSKKAIITGAGNGIGRQIAIDLARQGTMVSILDIDDTAAQKTVSEIISAGGQAITHLTDVSLLESVKNSVALSLEQLGACDFLVNCAGVYKASSLNEVTQEDWNSLIGVNLSGMFWCTQNLSHALKQSTQGRIINIASTGAKIAWKNNHAYCASKAGVLGLTKVLALELAEFGVTVNAICPGNTDTNMMKLVDRDVSAEMMKPIGSFKKSLTDYIPMKRLGLPSDVANLVCFLCSEKSSFITGQSINVDGGIVMS